MKKIFAGAFLIALWVTCAFAQTQTSTTDFRKFEVFAGYSANNLLNGNPEDVVEPNGNSTPTYRGWNVSAAYNFNRFWGVKADVSGYYKKFTFADSPVRITANASVYNYLAGVQFKDNKKTKRFSPFLQALAGVTTSKVDLDLSDFGAPDLNSSNTGFSMVFGGGVDLKVNRRFSVRLIQADYNPTFSNGNMQNNVRLGFGIVFH